MSCEQCNLTEKTSNLLCLKCENEKRWGELPVEHQALIILYEKALKKKDTELVLSAGLETMKLGIDDITVPNNL